MNADRLLLTPGEHYLAWGSSAENFLWHEIQETGLTWPVNGKKE